MLPLLPIIMFRKSEFCPTSETLLAYISSTETLVDISDLQAHVTICEFCSSEVQLLGRHVPVSELVEFPRIPEQLRRFAQDQLNSAAFKRN